MSLMGLGTLGLSPKMGLPPEPLIFYGGLLSRGVPASSAIEAAVEYFSGAQVAVDQFVGRWVPLDSADRTRLGQSNGQIGLNAVCGSQVWEGQSRFRVKLGPMKYKDFLRFLPSGNLLSPIFALVRFMVGIEYEFQIRVILKREEVPPCVIGARTPTSPRLGWSTWIKHPGFTQPDHPFVTFEEPGN
jgi:type VI secretion system protein ImpH